jgi:hypothetical protein
MTVLPIVGRELAVASRRAGTYWMRFCMAAGALAIFFIPSLDSTNSVTNMGQGKPGEILALHRGGKL